jgi:hypothetical protein
MTWEGPNGFSSDELNPTIPLAKANMSGKYTFTIITNDGCEITQSTDVSISTELKIETTKKDLTCTEKGSIQITTNGNFTYNWADIAGTENVQNRTNLEIGKY